MTSKTDAITEATARLKDMGLDWDTFNSMVNATGQKFSPDTPVPSTTPPSSFAPNSDGAKRRPNNERIRILQKNLDALDDLCPPSRADKMVCFVRSNVLKGKAETLRKEKKYSQARSTYIQAANELLSAPLPLPGAFRSDIYGSLGLGWDAIDLVGCINGVVECSRQLEDYTGALRWLEEAEIIDRHLEIATNHRAPISCFEWKRIESTSPDYHFERITTLCLSSAVFLAIGNTGSAVERRWLAQSMLVSLPTDMKTAQIQRAAPMMGSDILGLRHPDPHMAPSLSVQHPDLQVSGSWQKLDVKKGSALGSRMRCATLAFGQLYVMGGEKYIDGPWYRDLWSLDLEKLDGWRQLSDFPLPKQFTGDLVGFSMVPHADGRAFVFTGCPMVAVFDTKRKKWSVMRTTIEGGEWPYASMRLLEYSMQCVRDRLYVFGGTHEHSVIGCDLLMELHIPSAKWRRLSGAAVPVPSDFGPGPRTQSHSWVAKDKTKIFFMYGEADRQGAMLNKQPHAAFYSYGYDDLWSWDIMGEKWTRERLRGNIPSPRAEMSCTYNAILDKVVVFGGYSPTVPTWFEDIKDTVTYSYYADTFICEAASPVASASEKSRDRNAMIWKQVLTHGFPTYRAQAALVTDSKTGKIFLFGGYKNTTYVRSQNPAPSSSRSFIDVWQLRLDVLGGFFDGVDLEEESRTAKAGPWQRCFNCGSTGPWKRCGGACNGRVFFCDSDCLKEGWKEHKDKHGCRRA
ncbi:hypothetical protein B0H10DRAFT_2244374 [Mycena sp. CBHHK59/15]|nr:hypothetical protein B0H10DRAFT_2244374 [Mycena sp. CBHHK59/15]